MRYAIVSDLHANIEALSAVVASIGRERIDQLVCLGDIVGYNASPNECVERVRALGMRSISGNHDRAAVGEKDPAPFGWEARRAIAWTKAELTHESVRFLHGLPRAMLVDQRFFVVHGALHPEPNDDLHLSNPTRVDRSFAELMTDRFGSRICFFGHTHHALAYERSGSSTRRISPERIELCPGAGYLINPGSVGQSRDGDARAVYAVFDTREGAVEWKRVPYDVGAVERRNRAAGLGPEPFVSRSITRMRAVIARS